MSPVKTHAGKGKTQASASKKSDTTGRTSAKSESVKPERVRAEAPKEPEHAPKAPEALKKKDLKRFREILIEKKDEILKNAKRTLSDDMTLDTDDLADEMDLASSEYLQSFTFRLRGREKTFLKKIDLAIAKIEAGTFGICEECGEPISVKRLEARPETALCIRCKEDQERTEKAYG